MVNSLDDFRFIKNTDRNTTIRRRFLSIPEIGLGPYLIVGFIGGEGLSHRKTSFEGIETPQIECEEDLSKVDRYWHSLLAYQQPRHFPYTKYDPGFNLYKENWKKSKE